MTLQPMTPATTKQCLSVETLRDYLGHQAAEQIMEHFGGQTIKLPDKPAGVLFATLCAALGETLALRFVDTFRGERIYIATNERALRESMANEIMRLRAEGLSFEQIAARYRGPPKRYTPSGLVRLVKRVKEAQT